VKDILLIFQADGAMFKVSVNKLDENKMTEIK
jgi:hypothetical protein